MPPFKRTDIWREGKWLDLWSVVHLLSGASTGLGFFFLPLNAFASVTIALLAFVLYEMWEALVKIEETPTNRFMDVVCGMITFLPAFFLVAPQLSEETLITVFSGVLGANIGLSFIGWRTSQKAAVLEQHMRVRYEAEKKLLRERRARRKEAREKRRLQRP